MQRKEILIRTIPIALEKGFLKTELKIWLAFAAIYIIWGTTYLAIKIGLQSMPPFLMASLRYILAGSLLLLICLFKKEKLFTPTTLNNILLGAFMMTCGQAVLFWAEKYISSGLTSIFGSTLPIWYMIADRRNRKLYAASKWTLLSIALGLVGISFLFIDPARGGAQTTNAGMAVVASLTAVASCFCWAAGSLYYKYQTKFGSLFQNVGWQLIGGFISAVIVSGIIGEWRGFSFHQVTGPAWIATIYLAIAGSIIAFIALYWLLDRRPAPAVGTYAYVNPVIAVLLGFFLAAEKISILQVLGMAIILVAAWLANSIKFKAVI